MPAKRVFLAATGQNRGKTTTSIGLLAAIRERDLRLGFLKPVGQRYLVVDGTRADEEASAKRDPQRRGHARLDRADALPRALDAPADGGIEDASAGDLEAREPCAVEDLGDAQHLGGRQLPREGLLREQPDSRVDELRHGGTLPRRRRESRQAREM